MLSSSTWTITSDYQDKEAATVFSSLGQVFKLQGESINHGRMNNVCRMEVDGVNYFVKRYVKAGKGLRRYIGKRPRQCGMGKPIIFPQTGPSHGQCCRLWRRQKIRGNGAWRTGYRRSTKHQRFAPDGDREITLFKGSGLGSPSNPAGCFRGPYTAREPVYPHRFLNGAISW